MNRRKFIQLSTAAMLAARVRALGAAERQHLKIGAISDEISQDLEVALQFLQSNGLQYVEIRRVWGKFLVDADDDTTRRVRALVEQYKMKIPVLDTSYLKTTLPGTTTIDIDPGDRRSSDRDYSQQQALLEAAIARAVDVGAPAIRVFGFWRVAEPMKLQDAIAEHLTKAAALAAKSKIRLVLENEYSTNICSGDEIAAIFKRLKNTDIGLNWDPGNIVALDMKPFPDEYNKVPRDRIRHCHFKDAVPGNQPMRPVWKPIGKGDVDYLGQVRALLKDNFQGVVSLETHYRHPTGKRDLATQESLDGLLAVLKQA